MGHQSAVWYVWVGHKNKVLYRLVGHYITILEQGMVKSGVGFQVGLGIRARYGMFG